MDTRIAEFQKMRLKKERGLRSIKPQVGARKAVQEEEKQSIKKLQKKVVVKVAQTKAMQKEWQQERRHPQPENAMAIDSRGIFLILRVFMW